MTHEEDKISFGLDGTRLCTDAVEDAVSEQRNKRKVARFSVVEVRGDSKEIERVTMFVQQTRTPKIINTESKVVKELVFAFVGTEANLGKAEQALDSFHSGRCVLRTLENVEETKNECRRHWEIGTKGWELGQC